MSIQHFVEVVKARWKLLVIICMAFVVAGVVLSVSIRPRYAAEAAVVVEAQRLDPTTGNPLQASVLSHMPTEVEIARSERVAKRVMQDLGLDKDEHLRGEWRKATGGAGSFESWAAQRMLASLDVRPARESNVMVITYTSPDAQQAARLVNAFVAAYVDTTLISRQEPARQQGGYFEEISRQMRSNLEKAQAQLTDFQREHNIVSVDDRVDVENARLQELSSQVTAVQAGVSQAVGRERQAAGGAGSAEVRRDPQVVELEAEVTRLEGRLVEVRSRLGEAHPEVVQARNFLDKARVQLQAARQRAAKSIASETRATGEQLAAARTALETQQQRVLNLNSLRGQARLLQREVENAQRAYDAVTARASQAVLGISAGRGQVFLLKEATVPVRPRWPKPTLNVLAAALFGLLLGTAAVLWRERQDRRLRIEADVAKFLRRPLLSTLHGG